MLRNANPKYKIDRRRTRRVVENPAVETSDSESKSSVLSENDEEYDPEDNEDNEDEEDEVESQGPIRRRTSPRRACNRKRGQGQENGTSTSGDEKSSDDDVNDTGAGVARRSARVRSRKTQGKSRTRSGTSSSSGLTDGDDDENSDVDNSESNHEDKYRNDDEKTLEEDVKNAEKKNERSQKNVKLAAGANRADKSSSTRRRRSQSSERGGGILANLPCPASTCSRYSAVRARRSLTEKTKEETKHDDSEEDGDENENEDGRFPTGSGSENEEDSDYEDEEEEDKEIDEMLQNRSKVMLRRNDNQAATKKSKRKRATHSSDEEFVLDSDDDGDDSSEDLSVSDDTSNKLMEDQNDISMIGDPDLSEDDSDDDVVTAKRRGNKRPGINAAFGDEDDSDDEIVVAKRNGRNHASTNAANVDDINFGTIDDGSDSDRDSPRGTCSASKCEILPSPRGIENVFESDDSSDGDTGEEKSKASARFRRRVICPKCPSTEDAITAEPLPRVHVCYIAPDGKSRVCFNLETLRQIALKSSQLELRVDVDAERQNFLQPPAFRTAMSDDLVDQIASKFGRGALDLHGPYYKNREAKYVRKDDDDDDYSFESNNNGYENIYDSFEIFRERVKTYFRNGMGSQDLYVCPLCYGHIHRTIAGKLAAADDGSNDSNEDDDDSVAATAIREYKAAPSDSVYDPIMVLGHLDNNDMSMASQFCFKRLVDVKKHLRQEHNLDTRGIQGNELYKRFRVRAPDGLLQRWLSTQVQVRGQVKQGHMRMYWGQGNDQTYIELLDLIERVKAYADVESGGDSSEEDDSVATMNQYANKARDFFDTFAAKAIHWWKMISSPFLKSNDNMKDFIAKDDYYIEEEDSDGQQHAAIHQQLMNDDSDENDLVHKLKRKYAETNDEDTDSRGSSTEEELEFVDHNEELEEYGDDEDEDEDVYNRNGYYSPIEEEKDEWILEKQSQRKRRASSVKKEDRTNTKMKTPIGKRLFRRKTTPTATSSSTAGVSKKNRTLTLDDSSDDDSS